MINRNQLFHDSDLRFVMASHEKRVAEQVAAIGPDEFLGRSPDDLVSDFVAEYMMEVPILHRGPDEVTMDYRETKIDVSQVPMRLIDDPTRPFHMNGTEYSFHIPFEGDPGLLKCRPSSFSLSGSPIGTVQGHEIVITYEQLNHDADALKARLNDDLVDIMKYLNWITHDVKPFNEGLSEKVREIVDGRRERLLADRGIAASLGFRMMVRDDAPLTYAVPARRRKPQMERRRPAAKAPFEAELLEKEYERSSTSSRTW